MCSKCSAHVSNTLLISVLSALSIPMLVAWLALPECELQPWLWVLKFRKAWFGTQKLLSAYWPWKFNCVLIHLVAVIKSESCHTWHLNYFEIQPKVRRLPCHINCETCWFLSSEAIHWAPVKEPGYRVKRTGKAPGCIEMAFESGKNQGDEAGEKPR